MNKFLADFSYDLVGF